MRNKVFILLLLVISCKPTKFLSQHGGFKDSKSIANEFLHCLIVNDSSELRNKLIDKQFMLYALDLSLRGHKDSVHMDSSFRKKFDKLLATFYFHPFNKTHKSIQEENIIKGTIDSIKLRKDNPEPSSNGITEYELTAYFVSKAKKYDFWISVAEYQNSWYLTEVGGRLEGPYGYSRTYAGDKLIEEHKIGGDSIIVNH